MLAYVFLTATNVSPRLHTVLSPRRGCMCMCRSEGRHALAVCDGCTRPDHTHMLQHLLATYVSRPMPAKVRDPHERPNEYYYYYYLLLLLLLILLLLLRLLLATPPTNHLAP